MYISVVALRERTNYFCMGEEVLEDGLPKGCWVNVSELSKGSAVVKPETEILEFLDGINEKTVKNGIDLGEFPAIVYEDTGEVVFVDNEGIPVAFDEVMKVLFG